MAPITDKIVYNERAIRERCPRDRALISHKPNVIVAGMIIEVNQKAQVWNRNADRPACLQHAEAFLKHKAASRIRDVFDHVFAEYSIEYTALERKWFCSVKRINWNTTDYLPVIDYIAIQTTIQEMIAASYMKFFDPRCIKILAK